MQALKKSASLGILHKEYLLSLIHIFPAYLDQSVVVDKLYEPTYYRNKLEKWRGYKKPVHFILSASFFCNDYYTIEELSYTDEGGPVGEIQYTIKPVSYTHLSLAGKRTKNGRVCKNGEASSTCIYC